MSVGRIRTMTVYGPIDKIPWKVAIPILLFWLGGGVYIWFAPFPTSGNAVLDSTVVKTIVKTICSVAAVGGIIGTIAWATGGDT